MLLTPRPDNYSNLNNNSNMNLSPRHRLRQGNANSSNLSYQLAGQLLPKCRSPRLGQKAKLPPHITICPPDSMEGQGMRSRYLDDDELDNDVFQSPTRVSSPPSHSSSSPYSDEKHQVHSGRLYLIRQTGSSSSSSSPSGSPSRSPSKSPVSSFPFRPSSPMTTQRWASQTPSSPTSPSSSPSNRKTSVLVRVYRCNTEHFAIISRDALYTSKPVYVNMKHCRVIPGDCLGRFIVAGKCDSGNVIEFETPELSCLEQWLDAFQTLTPPASPSRMGGGGGGSGCSGNGSGTPPIPRTPALPTLAETEEEN